MISVQQKPNHSAVQNGLRSVRLHLHQGVGRRQYRIIKCSSVFRKQTGTDTHKLACFVDFPVPFDGGERRPGTLFVLRRHVFSCYGLFVAHKLYLFVQLLMTLLQPLRKLPLDVASLSLGTYIEIESGARPDGCLAKNKCNTRSMRSNILLRAVRRTIMSEWRARIFTVWGYCPKVSALQSSLVSRVLEQSAAAALNKPWSRNMRRCCSACISILIWGGWEAGQPALCGWSFLSATLLLTREIPRTKCSTNRLTHGLSSILQTVSEHSLSRSFFLQYCGTWIR